MDAANVHHCQKGLGYEPATASLALEVIHQRVHFRLCDHRIKRYKNIWVAKVGVVFDHLITEDQVIAKSVPGQIGNDAMILMVVVANVREYQVRTDLSFQSLERLFQQAKVAGEKAVMEIVDSDVGMARSGQENPGTGPSLFGPHFICSEDDPMNPGTRVSVEESKDRTARTDLDIVSVRAKAQDFERSRAVSRESQILHSRSGMTRLAGAWPELR